MLDGEQGDNAPPSQNFYLKGAIHELKLNRHVQGVTFEKACAMGPKHSIAPAMKGVRAAMIIDTLVSESCIYANTFSKVAAKKTCFFP